MPAIAAAALSMPITGRTDDSPPVFLSPLLVMQQIRFLNGLAIKPCALLACGGVIQKKRWILSISSVWFACACVCNTCFASRSVRLQKDLAEFLDAQTVAECVVGFHFVPTNSFSDRAAKLALHLGSQAKPFLCHFRALTFVTAI
mmetsp:Transcript_33700/g.100437  ORF Transcript_33700/g.100437 Transcript_33700/m.100437 type:complete len:145 (-) Transcript_33700:984-1418(-)